MAQQKKAKTSGKKKTAAGGKAKKPVQQSSGSNNAFFILVIIILLTVIVLLVNRYADKGVMGGLFKKSPVTVREDNNIKKQPPPDDPSKKIIKEPSDKAGAGDDNKESAPSLQEKEIAVYFLKLDEKTEKIYLSRVRRRIKSESPVEAAIESLIKGPTTAEENMGYITAVPSSLKVRSINIRGRTVEIDFSGVIEDGAAGEIAIKRVQQIVYTATQFDAADSVIILIEGKRRKTLGSDGFSISGPLRR